MNMIHDMLVIDRRKFNVLHNEKLICPLFFISNL